MNQRAAVLLQTHKWSELLRLKFERLRREIGGLADVFVLMQQSPEAGQALAGGETLGNALSVFEAESLPGRLGYPYSFENSILPGSTHFPVLEFGLRTTYDFVCVVEYDVDFSGNWGELVASTLGQAPDFASLHFFSPAQKPQWPWWRLFRPGKRDVGWARDGSRLLRSFNPVYCLSRRAVTMLHAAHRDGWRGHYELLLATLLAQRGGKLVDLRESGQFCIGSEQDLPRGGPVEEQSTVRWRPRVSREEFSGRSTGRTLFHPVKDSWYFDGSRLVSLDRPQ